MKGFIHVYTGNGKGKTTAALGLALRAAGAGHQVFIMQFVKGMKYAEVNALEKHQPQILIKQTGLDCFIKKAPTKEDILIAQKGLKEICNIIAKGEHRLVILDEANIALYYKLFSAKELIDCIKDKPDNIEIVITGRYAPQELIDYADLVTEMKEIKHYYTKGIEARKGIEF